jgi:hypothetical protein
MFPGWGKRDDKINLCNLWFQDCGKYIVAMKHLLYFYVLFGDLAFVVIVY